MSVFPEIEAAMLKWDADIPLTVSKVLNEGYVTSRMLFPSLSKALGAIVLTAKTSKSLGPKHFPGSEAEQADHLGGFN